jgi:hypothetical protein
MVLGGLRRLHNRKNEKRCISSVNTINLRIQYIHEFGGSVLSSMMIMMMMTDEVISALQLAGRVFHILARATPGKMGITINLSLDEY